MNEIELLEKRIELEQKLHDLEICIKIWTNEIEKAEFIIEYENINTEIEQLVIQLTEVEDKQ